MAAFQGDLIFQAPRRFLLEQASKTQTAFAYRMFSLNFFLMISKWSLVRVQTRKSYSLSWSISRFWYFWVLRQWSCSRFYWDWCSWYLFGPLYRCLCWYTYPVNFANTGDPTIPQNPQSLLCGVDWQPWNSSLEHPLLTFLDPAPNVSIAFDTYRVDAMNLLNNISLEAAFRW